MKELYKKLLNEVESEHETSHLRVRNSKVLIIDGLNTFIRSWTTNPAMNEDGDHMGGVTGTLNSIGSQIRQFNPTRVIVIFDGKGGSNSRKKIYEGYKSERGKNRFRVNRQYPEMMNEEDESVSMKRQFVWLADILDYLPVTTMIYDGMEADDAIAYIATELKKEGEEVVIASTDKDFLQLVNETTKVYSPTKKKFYDRQMVFDEWGLWPQNLLLFRTLDGDNSDNVPGVKGCGLKTVLKRFPELYVEDVDVYLDSGLYDKIDSFSLDLKNLNEGVSRDWMDSEYADEYGTYKDLFMGIIKDEIKSYGQDDNKILLGDSNRNILIDYRKKTKELWYDYSFGDFISTYIPWHIYNRHFKYALSDFFEKNFPEFEVKSVKGANIHYY